MPSDAVAKLRDAEGSWARGPPNYVLLAWNLADEVLKQKTEYRQADGRFVASIPSALVM